MKICYACNSENSGSAKFCRNCGIELKSEMQESSPPIKTGITKCPDCGSEIFPNAKFCRFCGSKLVAEEVKEFKHKDTEVMEKLVCKHGCGGTLKQTEDPGIFRCEFCGSRYLIKRESGTLIVKEIKEQIREISTGVEYLKNGVDKLTSMQEMMAQKENARIDLEHINKKIRTVENLVKTAIGKTFGLMLLLGIGLIYLGNWTKFEGFTAMGVGFLIISVLFWLIIVFLSMHYNAEKSRLLEIVNRKIEF